MNDGITIIGGGLAGCEAAWQLALRGHQVRLYEMRPAVSTGAHQTAGLAELVCSNSLGSKLPDRASGVLMHELKTMGSMLLGCAEQCAVPAGGALAVDRKLFSEAVTAKISSRPEITVIREEVQSMPPGNTLLASGPLTSSALAQALSELAGEDNLAFFDALAPIIDAETINWDVAFKASRYGRGTDGEGDYVNCPLNIDEYELFVDALISAERIPLREFEQAIEGGVKAGVHKFFEGCLPVEIIARRGRKSLAFGPMRPVGLTDPRTERRPHAVLQLRKENIVGTAQNMVGFQTNLTYKEQKRVFRLIPGLENVEFLRYGQMHRNTFINSRRLLHGSLQFKQLESLFIAGQLTGVEGYLGNIATGLFAAINMSGYISGQPMWELPSTTMLGALINYITCAETVDFQPMKANMGILDPLEDGQRRNKRERAHAYAERAALAIEQAWNQFITHDANQGET